MSYSKLVFSLLNQNKNNDNKATLKLVAFFSALITLVLIPRDQSLKWVSKLWEYVAQYLNGFNAPRNWVYGIRKIYNNALFFVIAHERD